MAALPFVDCAELFGYALAPSVLRLHHDLDTM
jgi:hypothetical protein